MNILIAEDEKDIRTLLELSLKQERYSVFTAKDGLEALKIIQSETLDLAILDVMMPYLDGFNLLRKIREKSTLPVMFLTARGEEMDKILGLGIGADDYLVKPFSMLELLARVEALLRRSNQYLASDNESSSVISISGLVLDKDACCVYKGDKLIELKAKEYLLLKHLMENPGRVYTKKQLYMEVWNEDLFYDENTIMVHISHIRNKIEKDSKNPRYIKTIRGIGYKFDKLVENNI